MSEFQGKIALVTGGSRGIGRAVALQLAKRGAHVYVNYSTRSDAAKEVAALCAREGGKASIVGFDVSNSTAVDDAFEKIKKESGRIDILVNNAGIAKDGLFVRYKNEDWDSIMKINLDGAFYCARAAAKIMMKERFGRIINMSSVVAEMGNPGQVAYVSSKAALVGFSKALAKELGSRNITVNTITPGFIETDMTHGLSDDLKAEHLKVIPLGRYGAPEDVAQLVVFLAGDGASYITGQTIGVNGGMYM